MNKMKTKTTFPRGESINLNDFIIYAQGSIISKTILDKGVGNITLFSFDQGQGLSEHTSSFDAVAFIIDGTARVVIDAEPKIIKAGEMIIMPANIPHSLEADQQFKMLLIMIRKKVDK
jgi:quercetin dioxygenase-like cupin family protein